MQPQRYQQSSHPLASRLGCLPSTDPRNRLPEYSLTRFMAAATQAITAIKEPVGRKPGPVMDQGQTPWCTEFGWHGHVAAEPHAHPDLWNGKWGTAGQFYATEKTKDGLPAGTDGSTVHAGAQVLREAGLIPAYAWDFNEWALRMWVLMHAPAVIGINWYESMFAPDEQSIVHIPGEIIDPNNGDPNTIHMVPNFVAGGHCVYVYDYDYHGFGKLPALDQNGKPVDRRLYKCRNSWGPGFGEGGDFYLPVGDATRLVSEGGEVCAAVNWDGVTPLTPGL